MHDHNGRAAEVWMFLECYMAGFFVLACITSPRHATHIWTTSPHSSVFLFSLHDIVRSLYLRHIVVFFLACRLLASSFHYFGMP